MLKQLLLITIAVSFYTGQAQADLIISVTDGGLGSYVANSVPTYMLGDTAKLSVWAYDSNPAGRTLRGYNLSFDVGKLPTLSATPVADGKGFNAGFSSFVVTRNPALAVAPGFEKNAPAAQNYDLKVTTGGDLSSVPIPGVSNPFKLFDIEFQVGAVPLGTYDFVFSSGALDNGGLGDVSANNVTFGTGNATPAGLGGQFNVVPEPSCMGLCAVGLLGLLHRRRNR